MLYPKKCDICEESFTDHNDLMRHKAYVHLNVDPYSCEMCNKVYLKDTHLNWHMKSVHRNMYLTCQICGKEYNRFLTYKSHLLIAHRLEAEHVIKRKIGFSEANVNFQRELLQCDIKQPPDQAQHFGQGLGQGLLVPALDHQTQVQVTENVVKIKPSKICDLCGKSFKAKILHRCAGKS